MRFAAAASAACRNGSDGRAAPNSIRPRLSGAAAAEEQCTLKQPGQFKQRTT